MTSPLLIAQLFEPAGPRSAMLVILADLLAAGVIFTYLMVYSRKNNLER
jgi:hypothetical protein